MSDAFLDTMLDPEGPSRPDEERERVRRQIGQSRQFVATRVMPSSADVEQKYIPTEEELDEEMRNRQYTTEFENKKRVFGQQKALASAALRQFKDGSFEHSFLTKRLIDIDDAIAELCALKRQGAPLSNRVFSPLPTQAQRSKVTQWADNSASLFKPPATSTADELPEIA